MLSVSADNALTITSSLPLSIHRFINAHNAMEIQSHYTLTYSGNNIFLPTAFFQTLLQGHILAIPDPYALTGMSPLLTPTSSAGPANSQQRSMRVQFLLTMVQDRLSKEEVGKLLDQCVHVVATTQEICHIT